MKIELEQIYNQKNKDKKQLFQLKNNYIATIFEGCIRKQSVREIHKKLFNMTINKKSVTADKYLLGMMYKFTNKMKKISTTGGLDMLAIALVDLIQRSKINDNAKKLINHDITQKAEKNKQYAIDDYIKNSRDNDKWFYLASSHNDCAKDHLDYQGQLYIDNKAPDYIKIYALNHNIKTIQWVMGDPVWFITRPNCRHYFVSIPADKAMNKSVKYLTRKYKTHNKEGDRSFSTPRTVAIEEYEDRLKLLKKLYSIYPMDKLKNMIIKTEMLLKKWKKGI